MRLFIAREAVDTHLKVAGALIDPKAPMGRRSGAAPRRRCSTRPGIPRSGSGWGRLPAYGEFGPLATHIRFVDRSSRRLARTLFHCMVRFGPKLEKRQAVLGRLVEIGAELLAITAACRRAHAMVKATDAAANRGPGVELADLFSRQARRRVEEKLRGGVRQRRRGRPTAWPSGCSDEHTWLETGMVGIRSVRELVSPRSGSERGP